MRGCMAIPLGAAALRAKPCLPGEGSKLLFVYASEKP